MWLYKKQKIDSIDDMPKGTYGFIYEVIHTKTKQKYIGKKVLYFERNKRLGKRALAALNCSRAANCVTLNCEIAFASPALKRDI